MLVGMLIIRHKDLFQPGQYIKTETPEDSVPFHAIQPPSPLFIPVTRPTYSANRPLRPVGGSQRRYCGLAIFSVIFLGYIFTLRLDVLYSYCTMNAQFIC